MLPPKLHPSAVELTPYLVDSFGNSTRIDYGTGALALTHALAGSVDLVRRAPLPPRSGHETAFCALLFCLARLGVLREGDLQAAVTRVFARYLSLMRKVQVRGPLCRASRPLPPPHPTPRTPPPHHRLPLLPLQTTYWLEPAGSHGVWGLDDYQFLPFMWGSAQVRAGGWSGGGGDRMRTCLAAPTPTADCRPPLPRAPQLIDHPTLRPASIHNPDMLEQASQDYLYFGCVRFVKQARLTVCVGGVAGGGGTTRREEGRCRVRPCPCCCAPTHPPDHTHPPAHKPTCCR